MAFFINGTEVIDNSRNANNLGFVQQSAGTPFWVNKANVTVSFTVPDNCNALSIGPITIDNSVNVTVGSGESWTIV
jgi:hypothetical protein